MKTHVTRTFTPRAYFTCMSLFDGYMHFGALKQLFGVTSLATSLTVLESTREMIAAMPLDERGYFFLQEWLFCMTGGNLEEILGLRQP